MAFSTPSSFASQMVLLSPGCLLTEQKLSLYIYRAFAAPFRFKIILCLQNTPASITSTVCYDMSSLWFIWTDSWNGSLTSCRAAQKKRFAVLSQTQASSILATESLKPVAVNINIHLLKSTKYMKNVFFLSQSATPTQRVKQVVLGDCSCTKTISHPLAFRNSIYVKFSFQVMIKP